MIGNVIILTAVIGLTYFAVKVFSSELKSKPFYSVSALFLVLATIFVFIVPNVDFIKMPLTEKINSVVLDKETNKPLADVNVLVTYYKQYSVFMSLKTVVTYQYLTKTDQNGKINVKRRFRYLAMHFPCSFIPLITRQSGDVYVDIWKKGYGIFENSKTNEIVLKRTLSKKDRVNEIHRIEQLLDRGNNEYDSKYIAMLDSYLKELIVQTPVDTSKAYWLMEE